MRIHEAMATAFGLIALAACQAEEPENIQAKQANLSRALENRAGEIEAEAENGTDQLVGALDDEAAILANQANALADAEANVAADNGQ